MTRLRNALHLTRRAVLAGLLLPAGLAHGSADAMRALPAARQKSRDALMKVTHWGCQYQNVDLEAVARSDLDLIVLDSSLNDDLGRFVTQRECRSIQKRSDGSRRVVLGYLCVGEVGINRWYWPSAWRKNVPDWVGPENPNWAGARSVQYWNAGWQDLVFAGSDSMLDRIMDVGFDGVFLDRVDGYGDWGMKPEALDAMAELVASLGEKARKRDPSFILMAQNAEHILHHANLVEAIDAHSKESLLTGLSGPDTLNRQEDVDWSLGYLQPLQGLGIPTFATEYITEPELRTETAQRLTELGFKPFFGTLGLDRLPGQDSTSRT
ncbi:endo alpha-1,4 polygalactosaminidase [Mesorhizobium sp. IMUNJ 23232]|uniref:endo alpha-1,4 polygalactosaminidase n=1 Tax=Mesorhizobium sp. IMUNJ 23232 TaxID=3376064 RepID=UPI0037B5FD15